MNKILILLLLTWGVCRPGAAHIDSGSIVSADQITPEWLANQGLLDPSIKKMFSNYRVKTLLEFGVGFPTKYFLDTCNKVISVEIVTHGYGPEWVKRFLSLYNDFSNWIPIVYFSGFLGDMQFAPYKYQGSEHAYKACSYQVATQKNYALIDDFYITELKAFIGTLSKCHKIDAAFVSGNNYLRGDFAQLLFGKVPVIWAQGTAARVFGVKDEVYGYSRMVTPDDYEEIFIPEAGATVWIQKIEKCAALIKALKN